MNNNRYLFNLIKNHKIKKFIEYVRDTDDINVNIRDESDNYLINYAILFNEIDAVSILIHKSAKLDITDNDGRSILYVPIKFNFNKILNLLLHFNETNIGISLVDIKDKNDNIPLHYSIYTNNFDAAKMLIEHNSDINAVDRNGLNSLQIAIMKKNDKIIKMFLETRDNVNINSKSNTGETALHMTCNLQLYDIANLLIKKGANINVQDFEHEFSPLDYSIINNDIKMVALLVKNGANVNTQDFFGNTPLHYSIKEENYEIVNILIKSKYSMDIINFNLYNIDSQLPIHLLLEKEPDKINRFNDMDLLIVNSDLNYQDTNNVSPLHIIIKLGLWKENKEILKEKKLNVFLKDNSGNRPIDYVGKNDIEDFFIMVEDSYIFILRNRTFKWSQNWENMCNAQLFLDKMTENEMKQIIIGLNDDTTKKLSNAMTNKASKNKINKKDMCRVLIREKIVSIYNDKGYKCNYTSYPSKKHSQCIALSDDTALEMCTFTGVNMDILFGLIYLLNKHKIACSTIDKNFDNNQELCDYYRSIGIDVSSKCEFLNFEIIWVYQKIYLSSNFKDNFIKCIEKKSKKFSIIPLGIEIEKGSHANYLIYDHKTKEIERFEPFGSAGPYQYNYNPNLLDSILKYKFKEMDPDIKYIKPLEFMPKIGFQYFDMFEERTGKIGDPGGFCALWSIWYVDQRLKYPSINRKKLVNVLIKQIRIKNLSFKNIIRNYSKDIIEIRDKVLNTSKLTINDWINDQYTPTQFENIVKEIGNLLNPIIR
jgi:ankyrin repeat protein